MVGTPRPMSEPVIELTVVVPCFNERDNIESLVDRLELVLAGIAWEVTFVDDDSTDGTIEVLRAIAGRNSRVRAIQRIGRRGLASACVEGCLSSSARFLAVIDADLQHDEGILPEMLRRLKSEPLDIVVASRYVDSASTEGWESGRLLISRIAVGIAQTLSRVTLKDPMSGFFMVRRDAFEGAVRHMSQLGFKILFDLMASSPRPLRFAEIPYRFTKRERGTSKLDSVEFWHFGVLIMDKLFGRWLPERFVMFALVGGSGIFVHLAVLYLLLLANVPFMLAQAGAVVVAMTSNFILNNLITYRDLRLRGFAMVTGLLSFYAMCSIGALLNAGIAFAVFAQWPIWWAAGLAGALIGAVWNYGASRAFTWSRAGLS